MPLLYVNVPQAHISIVIQEIIGTLTVLMVLIPLTLVAFAVKELEDAIAVT
jgi:hypothetical protein